MAYRIYDPNGSKADDDGNKYNGWSSKFDFWKSVTDPSIQRLNTMSKHYVHIGKGFPNYDTTVDDLSDTIYDT